MEKFKSWLKANWLIVAGIFLVLLFGRCVCGCNDGSNGWAPTDVAGIYLVTSGTQTVHDNQGLDDSYTYSESDGALVGVSQSNEILTVMMCPGIPDATSLEYSCDNVIYDIDMFYGRYYLNIQGKVTITTDKTLGFNLQVIGNYKDIGYEYSETFELKAKYDENSTASSGGGG